MAVRRCSSRLRTVGSTVEPLFSSSSCLVSNKFPLETSPNLEHPLCQPQTMLIPHRIALHHITFHLSINSSIHIFSTKMGKHPLSVNIRNFPWQGIIQFHEFSNWATGSRVSDGLEVGCGKKSSADISKVVIGFSSTAGNLAITGS